MVLLKRGTEMEQNGKRYETENETIVSKEIKI